jgi:hypothetical protein
MHVKGLALEDPCGILPFPLSLLAFSSLREFQIQRSLKVELSPILTFLNLWWGFTKIEFLEIPSIIILFQGVVQIAIHNKWNIIERKQNDDNKFNNFMKVQI